jgi:hypothetical protein
VGTAAIAAGVPKRNMAAMETIPKADNIFFIYF